MKTLRVEYPLWFRLMPWFGVAFGVGLWLLSRTLPHGGGGLIWLPLFPFFLLALVLYLCIGYLEMNETFIRYTCPLGCFEMAWDEVERIETWEGMVLYSKKGYLSIIGFGFWTGADRAAAIELFNRKVNERDIPTKRNFWSRYKVAKGTRVKAKTETTL